MNSQETVHFKLILTDELRGLLNNQEIIREESQHNITLVDFPIYEQHIVDKTTITKQIFELLFSQYPEFEKNKHRLVVSTFRTAVLTSSGLNGETSFHRDNILFAADKDRNLIISWGIGTDSLNLDDSKKFLLSKNKVNDDKMNGVEIDYESTQHLWKCEKYIEHNDVPIFSSLSPDIDGNMNCLIMSGKEVFHRRSGADEKLYGKYWRYVLNVYFNSDDFE